MRSSLLLCSLLLALPARAELSPGEDEPGFRIYDLLAPPAGADKPRSEGAAPSKASRTRQPDERKADKADKVELRGKLLVVGEQDITLGGATWKAGSNYWFWSKDPATTGADPCKEEPLRKMAEPTELESFAVRVAVDGMKPGGGDKSSFQADGSLPGTSCRPEHAARGPSRLFDHHAEYAMREKLSGARGTLFRLELSDAQGRQALGYVYHDPAAPSFGDPGRIGWFLETELTPDSTRALSQLAAPQRPASRSTYQRAQAEPRGLVHLEGDELLIFTRQEERPEKVRGVNTIDVLNR